MHSLDSASGFEPLGRGIEALRALFHNTKNYYNPTFYMVLRTKPKIATKDVMDYIKKKEVVTYLQLVAEFCPDSKNLELRKFVGHNIRQKLYLQINRRTIKRISKGKYKYIKNHFNMLYY